MISDTLGKLKILKVGYRKMKIIYIALCAFADMVVFADFQNQIEVLERERAKPLSYENKYEEI